MATQLTPEQLKFFQEQINKISQGAQNLYKQKGLNAPPVITPANLTGSVQPFKIPSQPFSTAIPKAEGMFGMMGAEITKQSDLVQQLEEKKALAQANLTPAQAELIKTQKAIADLPNQQAQLEEDANIEKKTKAVLEAKKQVTAYDNQLIQEQVALQKQIEVIEKNESGMLKSGVQDAVNKASKDSLSKQADISLLKLTALASFEGANLDLTTAQSIIDQKIALQTESLKTKFEFDKMLYEDNKQIFTDAEDKLFNQLMKEDEKAWKTKESKLGEAYDVYLSASENGMPESLQQQVLTALDNGDFLQAQKLSAPFIQKPEKVTGSAAPSFKLTKTDKGKLLGAGISPSSVTAIEEYLSTYGFDDTLKAALGANADLMASILGGVGGGFNFDDI